MDSPEGHKKIEEIVDGILNTALAEIKVPEAIEGKKKRPTKRDDEQ
jgi:hypothetical protein